MRRGASVAPRLTLCQTSMTPQFILTLMRHGRSRADDEGVHEGRYDSPLTDRGREQARKRSEAFVATGFKADVVIASTLVRARETAEIVAGAIGAPVEGDPDWMEMDGGLLAGLTYKQAEERFPTPPFRNLYEPLAVTGESESELHCRAIRAVERVVRRGPGAYLVVAHGGILNAALRGILGAPPPVNMRHGFWFAFGDTAYVQLRYRPDAGAWVLLDFNPGV